jgi:hypothetical protein
LGFLCDRIKRPLLVSEIDGCGCFAGSGKTATKEVRRQTRDLLEKLENHYQSLYTAGDRFGL